MAIPINGSESQRLEAARLDRAYLCFAFLGLVTLPFVVFDVVDEFGLLNPKTLDNWGELFEITLAIPLFLAMVILSVYGIVRTVQIRHPGLVALSAISVVCGGGYMGFALTMLNGGSRVLEDVAAGAFVIYIAANVLIPGWWFLIGRRRYKSERQAQE